MRPEKISSLTNGLRLPKHNVARGIMVYIRSLHNVTFNGLLIILSFTFIKTKLVRFHDGTKVYIYKLKTK